MEEDGDTTGNKEVNNIYRRITRGDDVTCLLNQFNLIPHNKEYQSLSKTKSSDYIDKANCSSEKEIVDLNSECVLLFDLLLTAPTDRRDILLKIAFKRQLVVENNESFETNAKLSKQLRHLASECLTKTVQHVWNKENILILELLHITNAKELDKKIFKLALQASIIVFVQLPTRLYMELNTCFIKKVLTNKLIPGTAKDSNSQLHGLFQKHNKELITAEETFLQEIKNENVPLNYSTLFSTINLQPNAFIKTNETIRNAENSIILQLLSLDGNSREEMLLKLAKQNEIILRESKDEQGEVILNNKVIAQHKDSSKILKNIRKMIIEQQLEKVTELMDNLDGQMANIMNHKPQVDDSICVTAKTDRLCDSLETAITNFKNMKLQTEDSPSQNAVHLGDKGVSETTIDPELREINKIKLELRKTLKDIFAKIEQKLYDQFPDTNAKLVATKKPSRRELKRDRKNNKNLTEDNEFVRLKRKLALKLENIKNNQVDEKDITVKANFEIEVNDLIKKMTPSSDICLESFELPKNTNPFTYEPNQEKLTSLVDKLVEAKLGKIIEGEIRINKYNVFLGYVTSDAAVNGQKDCMIRSFALRQFAMNEDIVRVFQFFEKQTEEKPTDDVTLEKVEPQIVPCSDIDDIQNPLTQIVNTETVSCPHRNDNSQDTLCIDCKVIADAQLEKSYLEDEPVETLIAPNDAKKPLGFVIKIVQSVAKDEIVGTCSFVHRDYYDFTPCDSRIMRLRIKKGPKDGIRVKENYLYVAKITEIKNSRPIGEIINVIGDKNDLVSLNKMILIQNSLRLPQFSEKIMQSVPATDEDFVIPPAEYEKREDLRSTCVFTIDPATARDLDDAVSCIVLPNGNFEVGVHISDVAHFIPEFSELDEYIREQATTIYLVDGVYHMLPQSLCLTCSLLPGKDKLAFSVFWEMTPAAEIVKTRYAKTVVRSCAKLSYSHAQQMLDDPSKTIDFSNFPTIEGDFKYSDLCKVVHALNSLTQIMRKKRFDNFSLKIDRVKITFALDADNGEPLSYKKYPFYSTNYLIEELALLANQSVAKFIYERYPKTSILRNHAAPKADALARLADKLKLLDYHIDLTNKKTISESLCTIANKVKNNEIIATVLNDMIARPQHRATYFCSSIAQGRDEYLWHFALSIPIYTHFTSPIRRYPDIIVHRLLAAALDWQPAPKRSIDDLHVIAKTCNTQKYNAKKAGDDSTFMYFVRFVKLQKRLVERAVVNEVLNDSLEIILLESGYNLRLNIENNKPPIRMEVDKSVKPFYGILHFSQDKQKAGVKVETFTELSVELFIENDALKANVLDVISNKKM